MAASEEPAESSPAMETDASTGSMVNVGVATMGMVDVSALDGMATWIVSGTEISKSKKLVTVTFISVSEMRSRFGVTPNVISYNAAMAALHSTADVDGDGEGDGEGEGRGAEGSGVGDGGGGEGEGVVPQRATAAVASVFRLLEMMKTAGPAPDRVSYGTAIKACAKAKDWRRAESLLAEMGHDGRPTVDAACYNSLLHACERAGQWDRVVWHCERMHEEHGLEPTVAT